MVRQGSVVNMRSPPHLPTLHLPTLPTTQVPACLRTHFEAAVKHGRIRCMQNKQVRWRQVSG